MTDRGVETPPAATSKPSVALTPRAGRRTTRRVSPKIWLVLLDTATVALAMVLAYAIRSSIGGSRSLEGARPAHVVVAAAGLPLWVWLFGRKRLYQARFINRRLDELRKLTSAGAYAVAAMTVAAYAFQLPVSRAWLATTLATSVVLLAVEREIVRRGFAALRRSGRMLRRVIVVGGNDEAREVADMLAEDPTHGYRLVGVVSDVTPGGAWELGPVAKTLALVRATGATSVIMATSAMSVNVSNRLVRELLRAGPRASASCSTASVLRAAAGSPER